MWKPEESVRAGAGRARRSFGMGFYSLPRCLETRQNHTSAGWRLSSPGFARTASSTVALLLASHRNRRASLVLLRALRCFASTTSTGLHRLFDSPSPATRRPTQAGGRTNLAACLTVRNANPSRTLRRRGWKRGATSSAGDSSPCRTGRPAGRTGGKGRALRRDS